MNDLCLGIAWFCFVKVKKFKNHFLFFLVSFLISHLRLSIFQTCSYFSWEIEPQCSDKVCSFKKRVYIICKFFRLALKLLNICASRIKPRHVTSTFAHLILAKEKRSCGKKIHVIDDVVL